MDPESKELASEGVFGVAMIFFEWRLQSLAICDSKLLRLVARAIRNAIRANRFAIETPIFKARQTDAPESLDFSIRANHRIRGSSETIFRI